MSKSLATIAAALAAIGDVGYAAAPSGYRRRGRYRPRIQGTTRFELRIREATRQMIAKGILR